MSKRDVIVLAASAGGIQTLQDVLVGLPAGLGASVLVVLHLPPHGGRTLPHILGRSTALPVAPAADGDRLSPGRVYCCVGDRHLLVSGDRLHVRPGPREHGHRPAADPLLRSAAVHLGPRVIGVILSGTLTDGTAGLAAVRRHGGVAVVQDPADARYPGMPAHALDHVGADHVVAASAMGRLLSDLVGPDSPQTDPAPSWAGDPVAPTDAELHEQAAGVEGALWMAMRALEDRLALAVRLAAEAEHSGRRHTAERLRSDVAEMERNVDILHRLMGEPSPAAAAPWRGGAGG